MSDWDSLLSLELSDSSLSSCLVVTDLSVWFDSQPDTSHRPDNLLLLGCLLITSFNCQSFVCWRDSILLFLMVSFRKSVCNWELIWSRTGSMLPKLRVTPCHYTEPHRALTPEPEPELAWVSQGIRWGAISCTMVFTNFPRFHFHSSTSKQRRKIIIGLKISCNFPLFLMLSLEVAACRLISSCYQFCRR